MAAEFENVATEEAQAARYAMMQGKDLLWVSCHYAASMYPTLKPMIKGVVDLGVRVHVCVGTTEGDRNLARMMAEDGLTASVIFAEMSDHTAAAENIYAAAVASGVAFDGVFSPHEVVQTIIGDLAERLGLPGNPNDAYLKARDKKLCRIACVEKGVPTPRYATMTVDNMESVVEEVGLPLVLKPSSGSGSEGTYKCTTMEEVKARMAQLEGDMAGSQVIRWSPGLEVSVLCEEYVDGSEFDVDMLLSKGGELVYANIIDNWPTMEPTFLETASNCPSVYSPRVQEQLIRFSYQCVRALGFTQGCFHVECKYSMKEGRTTVAEDGEVLGKPMLIEVNPRMGGGRTHLFHKSVYNVDLFDNFLMTALGIPINPPASREPLSAIADYDVCAPTTGILLHNRWLDHVAAHPMVTKCCHYKQPGDRVRGADVGVPMWVGLVVMEAKTVHDVCNGMQAVIDSIDVPIVPETEKTVLPEKAVIVAQEEKDSETAWEQKDEEVPEAPVAVEVA